MEFCNWHYTIFVLFIGFQIILSNPIANPQGDDLEYIEGGIAEDTCTIEIDDTINGQLGKCSTLWKFQDFSVAQILREIKFVEFRSSKTAIFALFGALKDAKIHENQNSEPLNVLKWQILHFLKAENYKINKIWSLKNAKMAVLELLNSTKLISRKI